MEIQLDGGKYTYWRSEDYRQQYALRYGQPWRDLTGDNLVLAMGHKIEDLQTQLDQALQDPVAQAFPFMPKADPMPDDLTGYHYQRQGVGIGDGKYHAQTFPPPPPLDGTTAAKLRRIKWIVEEWETGCSNTRIGEKQPPEACQECTDGAIMAIQNLLKMEG